MKAAPTVCVATAYHEAGHVVMGCITRRIPVSVTIVADGRVQGMVRFDDIVPESAKRQFDRSPEHERYISDRVMGELAGSIGHDLGCPGRERDEGDEHDDANALRLLYESLAWVENKEAYVAQKRQAARELLAERQDILRAVAEALLKHKTLTRDQILELVPQEKWLTE